MKVTNSLQGWFTLKVHKGDAEQPSQVASFENLITNSGLDRIGQGSFMTRCLVGTGNTPPDVLQTTLASLVASVSSMTTNYTATTLPPYYGTFIRKYRFNPGVATGNLTEVGVGWVAAGGLTAVFSRALIKDINGDPTTLTILPDEFLDVTYELRVYPTVTDVVVPGTTFTGFNSNVTIRPSFIADGNMLAYLDDAASLAVFGPTVYSGSIGPITGTPSGTSEFVSSASSNVRHSPYVVGSYKQVATLIVPLDKGNFAGGIGAIRIATTLGYYQVGFTPPVVKNATQQLILNLELTWGRYAP